MVWCDDGSITSERVYSDNLRGVEMVDKDTRQAKYRGWDLQEKTWVYGFFGIKGEGTDLERSCIIQDTLNTGSSANYFYFVDILVVPESVGQYTGTNDKNNVELYRNDIVRWRFRRCWKEEFHIGKIVWSQKWHCYYLAELDKDYLVYRMREDIEYEKMGSMYENPELLKKES